MNSHVDVASYCRIERTSDVLRGRLAKRAGQAGKTARLMENGKVQASRNGTTWAVVSPDWVRALPSELLAELKGEYQRAGGEPPPAVLIREALGFAHAAWAEEDLRNRRAMAARDKRARARR